MHLRNAGPDETNPPSISGVSLLMPNFLINILIIYQSLTVIEEANWLTLYDDIKDHIQDGFDAVICLGNSFAHLMDGFGDQREHKQAIRNFEKCLKPGGVLLIDHRNYDNILETGSTPAKSIYYNVSILLS